MNCPNCDVELNQSEVSFGWCDSCGKRIPVSLSERARKTDRAVSGDLRRSSQPLASNGRWRNFVPLAAIVAIMLLVGGGIVLYQAFKHDVEVYIDNGGTEKIIVTFDSGDPITVAPGKFKKVTCHHGTREIVAKVGSRTTFRRQVTLAGSRKYVLNLDQKSYYWKRRVEYGFSVPNFQTYFSKSDHYSKLAGQVTLVPSAEWFETNVDYVLTPAPSQVQGKFMETRFVLSRISRRDYDLIREANTKVDVTDADITEMEACVERVLASKP